MRALLLRLGLLRALLGRALGLALALMGWCGLLHYLLTLRLASLVGKTRGDPRPICCGWATASPGGAGPGRLTLFTRACTPLVSPHQ